MPDVWSKVPALPAAVGLSAGIFIGFCYSNQFEGPVLTAGVGILLLTGLMLFLYLNRAAGFAVVALAIGAVLGYGTVPVAMPENLADKECCLAGTVEKVTRTPETLRVVLHVDSVSTEGKFVAQSPGFNVLCSVRGPGPEVMAGAAMHIKGKLQPIVNHTDLPLETDYNRFLYLDGVVARVAAYSSEYYDVDNSTVGYWRRNIDLMQKRWRCAIADAGFAEDVTSFMLAVIGGDDLLLSEDMETQFRDAGLSHVLAISGMHVGIILLVLSVLLFPIKPVYRLRWLYYGGLAMLIVAYALITGGSPSACRAAAMCCVIMGGFIFEGRMNTLQSLSSAVVILLLINPVWLFMPGFQLSVSAILAIIAFRPLLDVVPQRYRLLKGLWAVIILPVIAVAGTLVPTLFYFHSISLNFWLVNIVAAIFIPFVLSAGFVCTLITLTGLHIGWLADATDGIYTVMLKSVNSVIGLFPGSQVSVWPSKLWLIMVLMILSLLVWLIWNYSHRRAAIVILSALVLLWVVPVADATALPYTEVYVPGRFPTTNIIVRDGTVCNVFTTAADSSAIEALRIDMHKRYNEFLLNRHIYNLQFSNNEDKILRHRNLSLMRVDGPEDSLSGHYNYALVSELFRGDLRLLFDGCRVDTVLLSGAIAPRRCRQYEWQLSQIGVPCRSLREKGAVWQFR